MSTTGYERKSPRPPTSLCSDLALSRGGVDIRVSFGEDSGCASVFTQVGERYKPRAEWLCQPPEVLEGVTTPDSVVEQLRPVAAELARLRLEAALPQPRAAPRPRL